MKKRILTLGIVLALVATMLVPAAALATNQSGQQAATFTGEILIVGKDDNTTVTQIWFPPAAPTTAVSNPWNNADDPTSPPAPPTDNQVVAASASEPVVRLKNTSAVSLIVWLGISDWGNDVVVKEDYELVATATTNVAVVDDVLSADGNAFMLPTGVAIAATGDPEGDDYLALYLEIVLGGTAGISGTSQLTILGSAP